jgi:vacuolar protein sorting-associated protein IST1
VAPRLESECVELKVIAEELSRKYGKEFAMMCRTDKAEKVNKRLMEKLSEHAPAELLVEKYLVEIAKSHNVQFKPKPEIAVRDPDFFYASLGGQIPGAVPEAPDLMKFNDDEHKKGPGSGPNGPSGGAGNDGGSGASAKAAMFDDFNDSPSAPVNPLYPNNQQISYIGFNVAPPPSYSLTIRKPGESEKQQTNDTNDSDFSFPSVPNNLPSDFNNRKGGGGNGGHTAPPAPSLGPSLDNDNSRASNNISDSFDDLSSRFENLKKK